MADPKQTPNKTADEAAIDPTKAKDATALPKEEQDELLDEALEESFPASDPMSSMHFTSETKKPE